MNIPPLLVAAALAVVSAAPGTLPSEEPPAVVDWRLDSLSVVGGHAVTVVGAPRVVQTPVGPALEFNGSSDGVFLDVNPLAGLERFTVEVLFEPAGDGPPEQRFLHFEEAGGARRALVETRMLPDRRWALDTFLRHGETGLTLLDRERAHPADGWQAVALVYDGTTMSHYVNGVRELDGTIALGRMEAGRTSIGVRQNKVYWFKGRIARVRITPRALAPAEMLSVQPR